MFAAPSKETSHDGSNQICSTKTGSKVKRKADSPEVTSPHTCPEPSCLSAASAARPLFSCSSIFKNASSEKPLSLLEPPYLITQEGPERAITETKWKEGPQLIAAALEADIPTRPTQLKAESPAEKDEPVKMPACGVKNKTKEEKVEQPHEHPLTGIEVVQMFARQRIQGELGVFYLKEVDGDGYRPYDLKVVHPSEAGSEHFIFSPNTVIHVTKTGFGGAVTPAEWYRECVLWTALQDIPFFRNFRIKKAFTRWHEKMHIIHFQKKCKNLQDRLLVAVPQFRNALYLFTRVIEELKETHWIFLDDSTTYTILDFKKVLINKNEEYRLKLKKLSQYHVLILNMVKEENNRRHEELQMHLKLAKKRTRRSEPIHLRLTYQHQLKKELYQSGIIRKKLGNFAALVHQMIVQSLITITEQDAVSSLSLLKRIRSQQRCLFYTELCFTANSHLTANPPVCEFHKTLNDSLLTADNTIIQMCENVGFFLEISSNLHTSDQGLISDSKWFQHSSVTEVNKDEMKFQSIRDMLAHQMLQPEANSLNVQGNMVRSCYRPLSKAQLEWHININDVINKAEAEQTKIIQDTELEIQQVFESFAWLKDIHLFVSQWGPDSLESMKDQPASVYEENIKKLRYWAQKINTVNSSVSTSNQLFIISCTHMKETLQHQLSLIEEQVLEQLVEQMKLNSESLVSDLERTTDELKTEPHNLEEFTAHALQVRESVKMLADMQKRVEYILSLHIICTNYRTMAEQELTLKEKMLCLWDNFIPILKHADSHVHRNLPSMTNALDTKLSSLVCELKNLVFKATSGPFLDPSQDASQMVSQLNYLRAHIQTVSAKLEKCNKSNQTMKEQPLDLTILTTDVAKVTARTELWRIKAEYTTWLEEWKQLQLSEVVISQAQEKMVNWKVQTESLINIIPTGDPVLEETLTVLESRSHQAEVMAKLASTTLRGKHMKAILQGLGLPYVPEKKLTVAEVISQHPENHQELIDKICRDAQAEWNMKQRFQTLSQQWKDKLFQLDDVILPACQHCVTQTGLSVERKPTEDNLSTVQSASQCSCNDARLIIIGLEALFAEIDNDLITLSIMLKSPHSVEFRLQLEECDQSLQELAKVLNLFERYQQMWAFLLKAFKETSFYNQEVNLLKNFQPVDETFKELMSSILVDLHVLNLVSTETKRFHGLYQILTDGLSMMETISSQMADLFHRFRDQFPRFWFLSDRELTQLLSFNPLPFTLQSLLCKCFKGVCWLDVDFGIPCDKSNVESCRALSEKHKQKKVLGFFGNLQEHISFQPPLEPNPDALVWLCAFEKQLKLTMIKLMKECAVRRNQLEPSSQDLACDKKDSQPYGADMVGPQPALDLLSDYPLQSLLVVEEAVWCRVVLHAFQEKSPVQLNKIKTSNSLKLKNLGNFIRDRLLGSNNKSLVSKYTMMCLRALVQLTMNHAQQLSQLMDVQCELESSFEWLCLIKYHISSEDQSLPNTDHLPCYVDVLGHRFQYGFEYYGPEDLMMVHTPSTDKAILGLALALSNYRCGFVSGPSMSGKTNTVVQLGKALGQLYVVKQCYSGMTADVVQQMLLGALQTGAWLLLESVDLLTPGVLSLLAQALADIHQFFYRLQKNEKHGPNEEPEHKSSERITGVLEPECSVEFLGTKISPNPSYGCVLISSKGHASKIPESLRFATRPIALVHPDYRIITEVTLTSIGFSEAVTLSHRLVSLISLAKDSNCLSDGFTAESCFLVVLQKIISASEIFLQRAVSRGEISVETKVSSSEHASLLSLQNMPVKHFEKDGKETTTLSKLRSSQLSVIQSLMEETSIVKAVLTVLIPERKRTSQFYRIFKDTFPIVCQFPLFQQYIEEKEKDQLRNAVIEELRQGHLYSDMEIVTKALTLYQAMKLSPAVILIGPPGSGKSTCYTTLAGALNRLAYMKDENVFENENGTKKDSSHADPQLSSSSWCFVDTLVLFPNTMSHDELFGAFCEKRGWKDGAVAKWLRDLKRHCTCYEIYNERNAIQETSVVKWLIMDGEPVGQPCWLDCITTMCSSQDPWLPSDKTLLSQPHLNLLMEITDLQDASPSAVTRCSLVYFTGTDLWKAVWKSEMESLSFEHKLDEEVVKLWNRLAADLFSSTLSRLGQNELTSANYFERRSCENHGLQEIMSFVRILRALLQHFGMLLEKPKTAPQRKTGDGTNNSGIDSQNKEDLLPRNLFLVAYIWGFGGHLHSRHWSQFDLLARQVLFSSRYKILVPAEESVFEHVFGFDDKIRVNDSQLTNSVIPKFGTYRRLLDLMVEGEQPVLLAGEPGSGKTTQYKSLSFKRPHINLPASPLLNSRDLRNIFNNICCQKDHKNIVRSVRKQPGLLLFVDDLHEAPCDVFGKVSAALETVRQSISKKEILTFDAYSFKSLSSQTVSYMATSCVSALGDPCRNVISLRLSRLFSIFVLPALSEDVLLSIHSPRMEMWLDKMPLNHSGNKMSNCVITATKKLYDAVCAQFQPTAQRPQLIFSHHDIQKVFSGMYLWQHDISVITQKNKNIPSPPLPTLSGLPSSDLKIVHLWMHECVRTFSDRLCSKDERETFLSVLVETAEAHYGCNLVDENYPDTSADQHLDDANKLQREASQSIFENDRTLTEFKNISSEETDLKPQPVQPQTLKHFKDMMTSHLYGPKFSETQMFVSQEQDKCLYQKQDLNVLRQELCALMSREKEDKTNDIFNAVTRYAVHRQGVSQLLHIFRALLVPWGHGVLISSGKGTGRKTTVRLAAYLTGYRLMEVHSNNENKLHEMLKEAGNQTHLDGVNIIILVHEDVSPPVREELLVAMAQKVFPWLYGEDELSNLVSRAKAVKPSKGYHMGRWIAEKSLSQGHKNVHVFLLMPLSDDENAQRWRTQMAKALKLSCCVEVYKPWSNQSLMEVAVQSHQISSSQMSRECFEDSLYAAMAGIHQSALQYASVFLQTQPFSPQTYLGFIALFGQLCNQLHKQWQSKNNRVSPALVCLDVLSETVGQYKEQTTRLQKEIEKKQQVEKMLLKSVEDEKDLLESASETCAAKYKLLHQMEELISQAHKLIKPVFQSGLKMLQCLNVADFEEVRHYRDPPDGVAKIMDAVCLLFNRPPGWESAKQLIGEAGFFQEMEFFDYFSLTNEKLQQLGQLVHSAQFTPESVQEVSKACQSLCQWVQAVHEFCSVQHQLVVNQQLEVQAREAQSQVILTEKRKKKASQHLEDAEFQLECIRSELEDLMLQLHKAETQEEEATACASKLEKHANKWRAAFQEAEIHCQNIPGDALLLAAVVSYLGPFGPDLRTELLSKWKELCRTGSININPDDLRTSLFTHIETESTSYSPGFPITVTERLQLPVGQTLGMNEWQLEDNLPARLVVKLLLWGCKGVSMQRWPLLADTEQHLGISSLNRLITGEKVKLEEELGFRLVVCADDSELLNKLDHAAEKGWSVLVTHLERVKPSPEFLVKLTRPAGCWFPGLQQPPQLLHPKFCLILSTNLPVRFLSSGIHPSVLAQVRVVDLSLSSEEIQELLLTQLLQSECRELLIQHERYQNYNQLLQEKLVSKEDALLDYVLQSDILLQNDSYFLSRVAVCQEEMRELQTELKLLREELEHHESLLAAPRQLMKLAAALYQALQAVARLSPAYYFSIRDFIKVMQDAFSATFRPLVMYSTGKAAESMLPEIMNTMALQLLVQYRPRLFKRHFAVLKLLVSLAVLEHNQLCSEAERLAFLRGLEDMEHPTFPDTDLYSSCNLPCWIPPHAHAELITLEKIPSFRGLMASLCAAPIQWQEYLHYTSSTVTGPVPCRSHSHLSLLQRALLWKTVRPSSLEKVADAIAVCLLCPSEKTTESSHSGNLEALSRYSAKHEGPIVLSLPNPVENVQTSIQPLQLINQLARCVVNKDEVNVKVISFGAQCDTEVVLSIMDEAVNEGHWLVFNNCHLLEHWDHNVVTRLSQLTSYFKEKCVTHPNFRLWFITQENSSHSLPATVRMCALPLVCDSPWDLREELSCSLQHVLSVIQPQSSIQAQSSCVSDDNMKMLVRCAIFHSVLQQRQNYKYLNFGSIYHWSQEDLLGLIDAHICIARVCHNETKVLQFIAVNLMHGSHVMDSADSEVVESVAKACFATAPSLSGSGPHMLSDLISSCGSFDISRFLQVLKTCFLDSAVADPVLLGFSVNVAFEITRINSHHLNLLLQASQSPLGAVRSVSTEQNQLVELPPNTHATERLQALKNYLAHKEDSTIRNVGTVSRHPLRDFLKAEWDDLIDLVSSHLSQLQHPVQNDSSCSSPLNLSDLSQLEKRAELISAYLWHDSSSDPPGAYRLSAFKNPRGFLVALMREAARQNYKYTSDIVLQFQVLCKNTHPALLPPDAVYLCGLELRNASWDAEQGGLQDAFSPEPFSMPLLCVKAQVRNTDNAADTLSSSSYLMNSGHLHAADAPLQAASQSPIYHCPLYVNKEEERNSGLTNVIITKVPLYTKISPVLCGLRRVRLVSTL